MCQNTKLDFFRQTSILHFFSLQTPAEINANFKQWTNEFFNYDVPTSWNLDIKERSQSGYRSLQLDVSS